VLVARQPLRAARFEQVAIRTFRPYPLESVRAALAHAKRVVVLEKAFAVGAGGIVGQNVRLALSGLDIEVLDVVAGLGGRSITSASLHAMLAEALAGRLAPLTFLDLNHGLVERELARTSGAHAENMLSDLAGRL
jgi:pyruvate ferredoxin oxidoreductase alpha subunit